MTEPSTGAGGTAVGITTGSSVWVRTKVNRVLWDGFITVRAVGDVPPDQVLPDHPALSAVAAWLNDNPDGATELWAHLDDLGEEQETPRLLSLRDALGDALSTDGGA